MSDNIINEARNKMPVNNPKVKFNIPMITKSNIDLIEFPKIKKAKFEVEESGVIEDKDIDVKDITSYNLKKMKSNELKKVANKLSIYDTKGGDEKLIRKILDKMKLIDEYKTI